MGAPTNLVEVLQAHVAARGDAIAYRFLDDGETLGRSLTFAELDEQARALAAVLRTQTKVGDRALLLYPPGLDFIVGFLGCQYAGVTAIPALPPNMNRVQATLTRLSRLVANAEPALVLTTAELSPRLQAATGTEPVFTGLRWQVSDDLDRSQAALWRPPSLTPDGISFLQYTSGSTSTPKGVMVSHQNLLCNLEMLRATTGLDSYNIVGWLPLFHDMGLIGIMLHGLYLGTQTRLMSPMSFLKRPVRWLRAIAEHGEVLSGAPNFAFELCLRRVSQADMRGLDLSGWRVAFCGSETVRASTLDRFHEAFAGCGLRKDALLPCYGLAEATLVVTGRTPGRPYQVRALDQAALERGEATAAKAGASALSVVSCGSPKLDQEVAIVDPESRRVCESSRVGEIWVRGASVARGYWNDPARSSATFAARTAAGEGPYMRTGDLGFVEGGELYVTGRLKEIIVVRGRCIYPQDLELMIELMADELPQLTNDIVAFALPGVEHERVGVIVRINRRKNRAHDPEALVRAIQARALECFELTFDEIVLVKSSLPKTSSGKKMRAVCRQMVEGGLEHAELGVEHHFRRGPAVRADQSPGPEVGPWLRGCLERILGPQAATLDTRATLAELGLDSLSLSQLAASVERELGVELDLSELVHANPSLAQLGVQLEAKSLEAEAEVETVAEPAAPAAASFVARKRARIHVQPSLRTPSRFGRFVNPFLASLLEDTGLDKRFVRGRGCVLVDAEGVEYLDGIAQYGALPFGHNPDRVWEALGEVRRTSEPNFVQPSLLDAAGELAERLLRHAPGMDRVTYANSGAEAVEAAIKLCRSSTGRKGILSTHGAFHGKTLAALSATGREQYQAPFGAPAEGFVRVPYGDADAMAAAVSTGAFAAVLLEPIQGEGGIIVPPPNYLAEVAELCRRHDTLLIIDEVQTGLGRTGVMFASIAQGVSPDVIVVAKALGGGLMPIGACLCRAGVYNRDFALQHSSTFAGNALACRAGLAVLDLLEEDDGALLDDVGQNGEFLRSELSRLQREFPTLIEEIRGQGYLFGIQLAFHGPRWRDSILAHLAEQGLCGLLLCSMLLHQEHVRLAPTLNDGNVLRVQLPLIATRAHCRQLVHALERSFARISEGDSPALLQHLLGPAMGQPRARTRSLKVVPAPVEASSSGRRFAFLVHPLDASDLGQLDPTLAVFSPEQLRSLQGRMHRQADPYVVGEMSVESPAGGLARGTFVALPHTAKELRDMPPTVAQESVEAALELALAHDPELIGLGAYSSVVTQGGLLLDRRHLPSLTSGSAFTAIAGEVAIERAMSRRGLQPAQTSAAIVGAAGQVGSALTLLLTKHAHRLVIVGNPAGGRASLDRLRHMMVTVVEALGRADAEPGAPVALKRELLGEGDTLRRWISTRLGHDTAETIVEELVTCDRLVLTNDLAALASVPEVLVTATSAAEQILDTQMVAEAAIVCELSRPFNVALTRGGAPGVDYIEGGVVQLPGTSTLGFNAGLPPGRAYACMAETMLLALGAEADLGLVSGGPGVSLDVLERVRELARVHGFDVVTTPKDHEDEHEARIRMA